MKIVLAPDSFKGTMTSDEVCSVWRSAALAVFPEATVVSVPISDGGEGLTKAYKSVVGGEVGHCAVTDAVGGTTDAEYILSEGRAVTEMAFAAGLHFTGGKNPLIATTCGVGELISYIAAQGVESITLGLGGSATNDCGIGAASALGYTFLDADGKQLEPFAFNLGKVAHIISPTVALPEINAACDVNNPLCGPDGATFTFGAQKGVSALEAPELDRAMASFADVILHDIGIDVKNIPGAGAAGGMGAAVIAFFKGSLHSGIDCLLDASGFDAIINDADIILTGEGRIDWQSAHGKAPAGVAARAKKYGKPCFALCGSIGKSASEVYDCGINAFYSAIARTGSFDDIRLTCKEDMYELSRNFFRTVKALGK